MPTNKRKLAPKPKQDSTEAKERELDTIRKINKVLDQQQVLITERRCHRIYHTILSEVTR